MTEYVTKRDAEEIVQRAIATDVQKVVDKAVTDLSEDIANFAQQVDERFNKLEFRVDTIDTELAEIKGRHLAP